MKQAVGITFLQRIPRLKQPSKTLFSVTISYARWNLTKADSSSEWATI